jgi:hypothetical protein
MLAWLCFKRKNGNPEIYWQTINFDAMNNQLDKFKFRFKEVLEKKVRGEYFHL